MNSEPERSAEEPQDADRASAERAEAAEQPRSPAPQDAAAGAGADAEAGQESNARDGDPSGGDASGGDLSANEPEAGGPDSDDAGSDDLEQGDGDVQPLEDVSAETDEEQQSRWYILKVQVNREDSIRDALARRVKVAGLDEYFGDIIVPTEDVAEFNKSGKRRIVKRKLYPGYIMVNMVINDDTWFLVRETPGIGDFTGSAGKPTPMEAREVERIIRPAADEEGGESQVRTSIPFNPGDRVRVKEGYFQNFEGDVESIDEANGRVTVMINIFGRSTPVELEHWQIESV